MADSTADTHLYRNQFIFGPSFVDQFEPWKKLKFGKSLYLTAHPALSVSQAAHGQVSILLLGFMIDPESPDATDSEILEMLARSYSTFDDLLERTGNLGGRWVLILEDGRATRLFNDAAGLRQVFFSPPDLTNDMWCASQASLIGMTLNLRMDEGAVEFIRWAQARSRDFRWPGDSSPYKEIKHLMPNHYLHIESGTTTRFWPKKGLENLTLAEACEKIPPVIAGLMCGASKRFDLAVALSAGWDSRLMLAACKEIAHKLTFMTVKRVGMSDHDADIKTTVRLASRLALKHDIIEVSPEMKKEFLEKYEKNASFRHRAKNAAPLQAQLNYYQLQKLMVVGNVSEVARRFYKLKPGEEIAASKLAALSGLEHPFAQPFIEQWLSTFAETYNINVLDLLYWEQKCANWLAMDHLEYDIAWQDVFTPYNTRSLLVDMLSVDEKFRSPPEFMLYERLIRTMWQDVLSEPIHSPRYQRNLTYYARSARQYAGRLKRKVLSLVQPR